MMAWGYSFDLFQIKKKIHLTKRSNIKIIVILQCHNIFEIQMKQ